MVPRPVRGGHHRARRAHRRARCAARSTSRSCAAASTRSRRRHDVLRTVIVADGASRGPVVLPVAPMPDRRVRRATAIRRARADPGRARRRARFDLEHEPPILVTIVRVADDHHVLSVVMHHVASDGWSFAVFFQELAALYGALRDGRPSPLPEPAGPVRGLRRRGSAAAASEAFERQLEYWRQQLAGPLPRVRDPARLRPPGAAHLRRRPGRGPPSRATLVARPRGARQALRGHAVHDAARRLRGRRRPATPASATSSSAPRWPDGCARSSSR